MIQRMRQRALKENRIDDAREDIISRRWEVYRRQTRPTLEYYPLHLIEEVNAMDSPAKFCQTFYK